MILGFRDRANWICSQRVEEFWVWRFSGLRVKRVRAIGLRVQSVLGFGCTQIWCVPRAQGLPVGLGIEVEALRPNLT